MNSLKNIRDLTAQDLSNEDLLARLKTEILEFTDEDDKYLPLNDLVSKLLATDHWEKAEQFAQLMKPWPLESSWFLGDIAAQKWKHGQTEQADALFSEALSLARDNGRAWQRGEALIRIARHYSDIGKVSLAKETLLEAARLAHLGEKVGIAVQNIQDAVDSSGVLREIAEALAMKGDFVAARQVASKIINDARRTTALGNIDQLSSEGDKRANTA